MWRKANFEERCFLLCLEDAFMRVQASSVFVSTSGENEFYLSLINSLGFKFSGERGAKGHPAHRLIYCLPKREFLTRLQGNFRGVARQAYVAGKKSHSLAARGIGAGSHNRKQSAHSLASHVTEATTSALPRL